MKKLKQLARGLYKYIAISALAFGAGSAYADFQLGFALDGSGSVSPSNYQIMQTGLSNAMAALPTDGTVEITVVSYGSGVNTIVSPTVLTAASLAGIQSSIATHSKAGGFTNTSGALNSLTGLMSGSALFSMSDTTSIINLATDGFPNSQSNSVAAGQAALTAGIDAISIEAIGSGVSSQSALNNLAAIAGPGPVSILPVDSTNIPNPVNGSFVVPVSNFTAFEDIVTAKVVASVTPPMDDPVAVVPLPGTLTLLMGGVFGIGLSRRVTGERRHSTFASTAAA